MTYQVRVQVQHEESGDVVTYEFRSVQAAAEVHMVPPEYTFPPALYRHPATREIQALTFEFAEPIPDDNGVVYTQRTNNNPAQEAK